MIYEAKDRVVEAADQGVDEVVTYNMDYTLPANVENLFVMYPAYNDGVLEGRDSTGNGLANMIYGSELGETLNGAGGTDTIYGKTVEGGHPAGAEDADSIHGGSGNDLIYGAGGDADTWDGNDSLYGDDGNDRIFGSFGDDAMHGDTGNDEVGGQAGNDTMYGDAGSDRLGGGTGTDTIQGGADADTLIGRNGADHLYGDAGSDVFDFDYVTESRPGASLRDLIYDFAGIGPAAADRVDLSTLDANSGTGGNQAFAFKGTAAFTAPGQVRVQAISGSTDTLIQANVTGASGAELEIQVKDGAALPDQWAGGDFIL